MTTFCMRVYGEKKSQHQEVIEIVLPIFFWRKVIKVQRTRKTLQKYLHIRVLLMFKKKTGR